MVTETIAERARELGRLMNEMRNAVRQQIQVRIKETDLDISVELLEIMALLWRKDGINQQEIADHVVKDKSSMTYLIDNLVRRNLVMRVEDEVDRRNKRIVLTKEGKLLQKKLHPWVMETYAKAAYKIEAAEIERAITLVKRMNENLKN